MRLYIDKKEASALIRALELLIAKEPQNSEARKLLSRIQDCLALQGKSKTKQNR